jgi:uncharacterized membrane protein YfcA
MNELSFRSVWISLAVMLPIGGVGLFVLRNNQQAKGMLVLGLLVCAIALRHFLDRHELREPEDH